MRGSVTLSFLGGLARKCFKKKRSLSQRRRERQEGQGWIHYFPSLFSALLAAWRENAFKRKRSLSQRRKERQEGQGWIHYFPSLFSALLAAWRENAFKRKRSLSQRRRERQEGQGWIHYFPSLFSALLAAWRGNVFKRKDRSRRDAKNAKMGRSVLPAKSRLSVRTAVPSGQALPGGAEEGSAGSSSSRVPDPARYG